MSGSKEGVKPKHSPDDFWMEFLNTASHCCGLCGNTGIVDTRGRMFTPANVETGVRTFCICPNGREMKKTKADIEKWQVLMKPGGLR